MQGRSKLATIQSLRAIAASIVVLGHATIEAPKLSGLTAPVHTFNYGFGVDIFFVISGFIMTYTAASEFGVSGASGKFILARIARIVPIYWLLTTLILALTIIAPAVFNSPWPTPLVVFGSYFFIPIANSAGQALPILSVGWTLNYEMMFYVLFASALLFQRRRGVSILLATLLLFAIVGAVVKFTNPLLSFWTNAIILEFGFGIAIALCWRWLDRLSTSFGMLLMMAGFTAFVAAHFAPSSYHVPRFLIDGIPAAIIVTGGVICDIRGRLIGIPSLIMFGDASYSLYLSHMFSVRGVRIVWNLLHVAPSVPFFVATSFGVAAAVALALAQTLELPLHRAIRKRMLPPDFPIIPRGPAHEYP